MSEIEKFYNNLLVTSGYFPTFAWLLPLTIAIVKWRFLKQPHKSFFYFGFFMFLFNLLVLIFLWSATKHYDFWKPYLDYWKIENVLFTRILFHLNGFIFLGGCYFSIIPNLIINKYKFLFISILCLLALISYFFIDDYRGYGTIGQNGYSLFVIGVAITYLSYTFKGNLTTSLSNSPFFWISIGLLLTKVFTLIFQFTAKDLYETDFVLYCKANIFTNLIEFIGIMSISLGISKIKQPSHLPNPSPNSMSLQKKENHENLP